MRYQKKLTLPQLPAMRIQKLLSQAGVGSRRQIEQWITEKRIAVNDKIATLGQAVTAADKIKIDHKIVKRPLVDKEPKRVIIYHKPEGEVCTRSDEKDRPTVFMRLPSLKTGRWVMIGRLDLNSSGLLLFTNDGQLAQQMMHPKFGLEREYAVRVLGEVTPEIESTLLNGLEVPEIGFCKFKHIEAAGGTGRNQWYHVVLNEGKNREIRRLFAAVNLTVNRLIRIRYGNIVLPKGLKQGKWCEVDIKEITHANV